jgi:hypothetical protein
MNEVIERNVQDEILELEIRIEDLEDMFHREVLQIQREIAQLRDELTGYCDE